MTQVVTSDHSCRGTLVKHVVPLLVCVGLIFGCTEPTASPSDTTTATVTDPANDTFGAAGSAKWDLTAMTIARDDAGITVSLDFSADVVSPMSGNASAMIGFVDIDADQDSTTGTKTIADEFRPSSGVSGSTGMGTEYELLLGGYAADSTVTLYRGSGSAVGQVRPIFNGHRVTVVIPKTMLGNDDGRLNASAIVGAVGNPTDIIPDKGHLTLGLKQSGAILAMRVNDARR